MTIEVGPQLAMVFAALIASIGSVIVAWLGYKQALANKVTNEDTQKQVTEMRPEMKSQTEELASIKKDVNSTASKLADKAAKSETEIMALLSRVATAEERNESLGKEIEALKSQHPMAGKSLPVPVEVVVPHGDAIPVKNQK